VTKDDNKLEPQFPRHEPEMSVEEAMSILLDTLHESALLNNKGGPSTREGMMLALDVTSSFLCSLGVSGQQIWPLVRLRSELEHIWEGKRSLILQPGVESIEQLAPKSRHSGPGKQIIKLYATACAEAFYRLGRNPKESEFAKGTRTQTYKMVSDAMCNWPHYDTQVTTARTIKGWWDEISDPHCDKSEHEMWNKIVESFIHTKKGQGYLKEVLKNGPPMTGGFRK